MERFKPFMARPVKPERLKDPALFEGTGAEPRYLPETLAAFDEMEFLAPYEGDRKLVLSVALEEGRIQRILMGWVGPGDPEDAMRSFDEQELEGVVDSHGEVFAVLLEKIT
jgi:hypothetical protein